MGIHADEFFEGKRPWSKIKDQILGSYLVPYLHKVSLLKEPIILVDCFAGPGKFIKDNSTGSPLMFCQIAKKHSPNSCISILVNKSKNHHKKLTELLESFIKDKKAFAIHGDATSLLSQLSELISSHTLFIYLDPFGLKDFDFSSLIPYFSRSIKYSSEMLINVSIPTIHRLSGKRTIKETGVISEAIKKKHNTLSAALGGDYWKKYLFDSKLTPKQQVEATMNEYQNNLRKYLPIVGACPVFESSDRSTIKYYIVFASRHIDSAILLNDIMFKAYWNHVWGAITKNTLFESLDAENALPVNYYTSLEEVILDNLQRKNYSRIKLWEKIVLDNFMRYKSSDYRKIVVELLEKRKIGFTDTKGTGRLNDSSILYLKK